MRFRCFAGKAWPVRPNCSRPGITAATVSRMLAADKIIQLSRGLYQQPDAPSNLISMRSAQVANQEHRRVAKGASADTLTRTQSDVPADVDQRAC